MPDPCGEEWVRGFESRMALHRVDMAADSVNQAEWDRIEGLDERPPPSYREEDLNRPDGIELDPLGVLFQLTSWKSSGFGRGS